MAVVKATIKKRVTGGWDDIHPKTEVAQITDFDANVPAVLNDLTNVNASSPNSGDALVWNGSNWAPAAVTIDTSNFTTKYTWQPKIVYWDNGGTGAGFRNILKVESATLSTGGILYVDGTSGSVVVNARFEILVNHYQDIIVKSLSGGYTQVEIKVQSGNNDEFNILIARDRNDTVETTITATFIPYDQNATVTTYTNNPAVSYSTITLTHRTIAFSENITATGGSTGKLYVEGNEVWHAGNAADADGKVSKSGDTMTGNLNLQSSSLKLYSYQNTADAYRYIGTEYASGNGNNKAEIRFAIDGADTKTRIQFHTANGAANIDERMRITSSGNVGIGTTSPDTQLHIAAPVNVAPKLRLELNDSGLSINSGQEYGAIQWEGNDAQGSGVRADIRVFGDGTSGQTYMTFGTMPAGTSNATSATEAVRINSGGNVQISGTAPLAFTGNGNTGTYDRSVIYANINNTADSTLNGIFIERGKLTDSISAETRNFVIGTRGGSAEFILNKDGNVGIGTTSPGNKFVATGVYNIDVPVINQTGDDQVMLARYAGTSTPVPFNIRMDTSSTGGDTSESFGVLHLDRNGSGEGGGANLHFRRQNDADEWVEYGGIGASIVDNTNGTEDGRLNFFTTAAGSIRQNRMIISSTGNVGIGTTSPGSKLQVDGAIKISDVNDFSMGYYNTVEDAYININYNNHADTLIGTNTRLTADHDVETVNAHPSLRGSAIVFGGNGHPNGANTINFYSKPDSTATAGTVYTAESAEMVLKQGNLGIGTTSPAYKLDINNASNYTHLRLGGAGAPLIKFAQDSYNSGNGAELWQQDGKFYLNIRSNLNAMVVDTSGNVGIGTTSPSTKLFVNGVTTIQSTGDALVVKGTTTGGININPWGTNTNIDPNDTNGVIYFGRDSSLSNFIVQSGNVGIGITSLNQKLQVNGAITGGTKTTTGVPNTTGVATQLAFEARGTQTGNDPSIAFHKENVYTMYLRSENSPRGLRLFSPSNETAPTLTIDGNLDVTGSIYDNDANLLRIIKPKGGSYSGGSSHTGAIGITLPAGTRGSATMMSMFIDVYDYAGGSDGESWTIQVGGYNYLGSGWYNIFANLVSGRSDRFFNVRFSYDSGSNTETIWIGENNSNWSYPQIQVRDVLIGHSGDQDSDWYNSAFNVTIGTIIGSVSLSKAAENYASDSLRLSGYVPTENAAANSIAKRDGNGDLQVTDLIASATVTAGGNKLAWVKNGSTLQSGVTFSLSSGVLYISTTL